MEQTKLLASLVAFALILGALNLYGNFNIQNKLSQITAANVAGVINNAPSQPSRIEVSVDDDAFKGKNDAQITIVEFSDFECPFCEKFFTNTLPQIEEKYIKSGKVKFVYRDSPLPFHEFAQKAAQASECAKDQEKFWQYHDKLFQNQQSLDIASLKKYAKEIGLNTQKFNNCLDSNQKSAEIQNDITDATKYGVSGTPTFFINGIALVGAQPFEVFDQIIQQELNGKR